MLENIKVSPGPHISKHISTRTVMIDVIIGLFPAMLAACYFFRFDAVRLIATCVLSCMATELACTLIRKKKTSLDDFSAMITGIILALSLPASLPTWAAIIGSVFCIAISKMVFGGLGANVFNPAMVGRAFMAACFGTLMTVWTVPATIDQSMPKLSPQGIVAKTMLSSEETVQAITTATPLSWVKDSLKKKVPAVDIYNKQLKAMCLGERAGCLGETSTIAIIIGGIYLLIRKTITYHIPLAVIVGAFAFALIGHMISPDTFVNPVVHLAAGGLMLCAFFIATDPVTSPMTHKGMWLFGVGVGIFIMLIRTFGAYPEGVMYAVLLMNSLTPLIDRLFKLVPAGGKNA
jgi:electron transport complex protein RnfD